MLLSLDNDAVIQVLSHLTADELARFVCASHGTKSVGQRDACWASHVEGISAQYATEESQCIVDEAAPTEPEYSGPRLRMPYLTPWTMAEVEKRCTALRDLPWQDETQVGRGMGLPALARGQWPDRVPRLPSERGEDLSGGAHRRVGGCDLPQVLLLRSRDQVAAGLRGARDVLA